MAIKDLSGRNAARARRDAQVNGKATLPAKASSSTAPRVRPKKSESIDRQPSVTVTAKPATSGVSRARVKTAGGAGREASRARRLAMSSRGKSGASSSDRQRVDVALRGRNRVQEKDCGCGCNGRGDCGGAGVVSDSTAIASSPSPVASTSSRRSRHDLKVVTPSSAGRLNSRMRRDAMAAHGKTGVDSYRNGVSSARMARKQNPDISGRELARTVRAQRSVNGGSQNAARAVGRRRPERPGSDVSGTNVSHSDKTTGDETGLCRSVTGTEYFSSEVFSEFCQDEAPNVPRKVETSENLSGGEITASGKVGLSEKVTGNERGSCHSVTGIEYVGREQYDDFCSSKPEPGTAKVSFSQTTRGQVVSGSKPARSTQVSGNEVGSCKAVTGTPYTGAEHYQKYCDTAAVKQVEQRTARLSANAGRDITGVQPGFSSLTGAAKGACRDVSGTAYVGAEQHKEVCGVLPAGVDEPDFPKPLSDAPWGAFSVVAPAQASQSAQVEQPSTAVSDSVTGIRYEKGRVSGTFSLGEGKITGTEQFRFGGGKAKARPATATATATAASVMVAPAPVAEVVSKVTGEGLDAGLKITGNDWDRGDRVTGTEGRSAAKRNPTRRGPVSAMPSSEPKRNEDVDRNDINVTGGSGNTESGALVTLSGGARG